MKQCQNCGQNLAEKMIVCPTCGNEVGEGRKYIDEYRIIEVLYEGYSTILCKAVKEGMKRPVMIRIFTSRSGVDKSIADRLKQELGELKKLPEEHFVKHLEIRKSSDGLWYRVSEWIDTEKWGFLLASGQLHDTQKSFGLFLKIASILDLLHKAGRFMPRLILDDIIVFKGKKEDLKVKIDYKLSRFLDPKMNQPGPMLKKLQDCHPDILKNRPLDFRSDIWSLGKIFIELLTADHKITDFQKKVEDLALDQKYKVLLKIMLADEPDLRFRSMSEVVETIARIIKDQEEESSGRKRRKLIPHQIYEIRGIKKRVSILAIIMVVLIMLKGISWFHPGNQKNGEAVFEDYVKKYAHSVAFVMTEYWLKDSGMTLYRNRTEGTAFLVDKDGYLLTNRHVACPWLEDNRLFAYINNYTQLERPLSFEYRIYLWFEGEKAFKRIPDISGNADSEDAYFLESAFSTSGKPGLSIAGVAKSPEKTWQIVKSPLKDDFAVLKIDHIPEGLVPLPLDYEMESLKIPRLSTVITLGFPLGSKTQASTINVSVTRGNVRRTFENMIQVDTSIYRGNSGGPIIDTDGKVIGIASSVAMDWASGPVAVATRLSDLGMVLPITNATSFLQELKSGQVKWNGILDLSIDRKLKQIFDLANQSRWIEAKTLIDKELELSFDPTLVMAAGMMHFCSQDYHRAKDLFAQAVSLENENDTAKLMHYIVDWINNQAYSNRYRKELLSLDWRSSSEFIGHLVRVLEGFIDKEAALKGGYSEDEKGWLNWIVGLILGKQENHKESEQLIMESVKASDRENWLYFLAKSKLEEIQLKRSLAMRNKATKKKYQKEIKKFVKILKKNKETKEKQEIEIAPLISRLEEETFEPRDKTTLLKTIFEKNNKNGDILVGLVYYSAMDGSWDDALKYARTYLDIQGRETAARLGIGLLEAEILHVVGRKEEALNRLAEYNRQTMDPWYRAIGECLVDKRSENSLTLKAGKHPEYLVTAHTALAFWAEGSGDKKKAQKLYKEALGSYMDDMLEYEFAMERIKKLNEIADK